MYLYSVESSYSVDNLSLAVFIIFYLCMFPLSTNLTLACYTESLFPIEGFHDVLLFFMGVFIMFSYKH